MNINYVQRTCTVYIVHTSDLVLLFLGIPALPSVPTKRSVRVQEVYTTAQKYMDTVFNKFNAIYNEKK